MVAMIFRAISFFTLAGLVTACASNKDVKEIKHLITESQEESHQLHNRIDLLNLEIQDDRLRLNSLENDGAGFTYDAMELRSKIRRNQKLVDLLDRKVGLMDNEIRSNSSEIEAIKHEQEKRRRAIHEALQKNHETKTATSQGIKDLEKQYKEKRKYEAESWGEEQ